MAPGMVTACGLESSSCPELKSKPFACHPLFRDFVRAAKAHRAAVRQEADIAAEREQAPVRRPESD